MAAEPELWLPHKASHNCHQWPGPFASRATAVSAGHGAWAGSGRAQGPPYPSQSALQITFKAGRSVEGTLRSRWDPHGWDQGGGSCAVKTSSVTSAMRVRLHPEGSTVVPPTLARHWPHAVQQL